jgi:NTP pyrophosphatase (non-canonical NTP hydrolase)
MPDTTVDPEARTAERWFWVQPPDQDGNVTGLPVAMADLPWYDDMDALLADLWHDDAPRLSGTARVPVTGRWLRLTAPPGEPGAYDLFAHVADITAWLDTANPDSPHEDSMRVLKLVEEAGEAAAAYIGMVGQNPRKGVTHSRDDLLSELADVALTALCAIQHFTRDQATTRATLAAKTHRIIARSDIPRTHP